MEIKFYNPSHGGINVLEKEIFGKQRRLGEESLYFNLHDIANTQWQESTKGATSLSSAWFRAVVIYLYQRGYGVAKIVTEPEKHKDNLLPFRIKSRKNPFGGKPDGAA